MSEPRIVQENVRPAGTMLTSFARTTGQEIPAVLANASHIELVDRGDGSGRQYRNEVGDLILKDPNSDRLYIQYGVLINWHVPRTEAVPGLDIDLETGEVLTVKQRMAKVIESIKAQSIGAANASAESATAVMED